MAKHQSKDPNPLSDWIILVFVVVVMALLCVDLFRNVSSIS